MARKAGKHTCQGGGELVVQLHCRHCPLLLHQPRKACTAVHRQVAGAALFAMLHCCLQMHQSLMSLLHCRACECILMVLTSICRCIWVPGCTAGCTGPALSASAALERFLRRASPAALPVSRSRAARSGFLSSRQDPTSGSTILQAESDSVQK